MMSSIFRPDGLYIISLHGCFDRIDSDLLLLFLLLLLLLLFLNLGGRAGGTYHVSVGPVTVHFALLVSPDQ